MKMNEKFIMKFFVDALKAQDGKENFSIKEVEKAFTESLFEAMEKIEKKDRIVVGKLSDELYDEYKNFSLENKKIQHRVKARVREMEAKAEREIIYEFGDHLQDVENRHERLWKKIEKHAGLDRKKHTYTIDKETAEVYIDEK